MEYIGYRCNKLTVVEATKSSRGIVFKCLCDCGNYINLPRTKLIKNNQVSCGCAQDGDKYIGLKFGNLIIKDYIKSGHGGNFVCQCDCGKECEFNRNAVLNKNNQSCGCMATVNIIGRKINRLTILSQFIKDKRTWCKCLCDCGNEVDVYSNRILSNHTKSCGCLRSLDLRSDEQFKLTVLKRIVRTYRANARLRNLPYELPDGISYELLQGSCYYCGDAPNREAKLKNSSRVLLTNGIDRKNSSKGYYVENTVSCCTQCNYMKMKMTKEEFIIKATKIAKNFEENT